jgi:enoyl-CoA hydratase/carnithine racemase
VRKLLGNRFSAPDAESASITNRAVTSANLEEKTVKLANWLAAGSIRHMTGPSSAERRIQIQLQAEVERFAASALRTYRDRYEELTRVSWQHPVYRHRRRSKSKFLSLLPGTRPS